MRITKSFDAISIAAFLGAGRLQLQGSSPAFAQAAAATPNAAVEPQYDTNHVYVAPEDFDRFVARSWLRSAGRPLSRGASWSTPTPSSTMSQLVLTPVGTLSVFGFKTPGKRQTKT